jgi:hypothetical protein
VGSAKQRNVGRPAAQADPTPRKSSRSAR